MAHYLGNRSTHKVHDLEHEDVNCEIPEIEIDHRIEFDSLRQARDAGYDDCDHCIAKRGATVP